MRILLDESLPRPLARLLLGHEVRTAVVVLVATTNRIESLRPLIPALVRTLETLAPRRLVHVGV